MVLAGVTVYMACAPVALEQNMHPDYFPINSLKALAGQPPGRVLNRYRFGGAVSAIAGPGHKVFIDGRNDMFPEPVHEQYRKLVLMEPGWREILNSYHPDYILWSSINRGEGLYEVLKLEGDFELVVEDRVGMLWVRKSPPEDSPR